MSLGHRGTYSPGLYLYAERHALVTPVTPLSVPKAGRDIYCELGTQNGQLSFKRGCTHYS